MKQEVYKSDFVREFDNYNRSNHFSVAGRKALYDYLDEIDENYDLDVIALCCEYSEYESVSEFVKDYGFTDIDIKDYDDEQEEFEEAVKEHLRNNTTLIEIDDESFIIQCF